MARKIIERCWVISGKPGIFRLPISQEGGEDAGQEVTDEKDERGPATEMGAGADVPASGGEPGLGPLDRRRIRSAGRRGGAQLALASRL